jgi:hypothetical protein
MRIIIAGSRAFTFLDYSLVENACLSSGYWFTTVLSGQAEGVDKLGEEFARRMSIPVDPFPADWAKYGNGAGIKRNLEMVKKAQALVAIWDGRSPGTQHVISAARAAGLLVHVRRADPTPSMPTVTYRGH